MAGITYIGTTKANGDSTAKSCTPALPTGWAAGDLLLAFVQVNTTAGSAIVTPPSGWTRLAITQAGAGQSDFLDIWWKIAASGQSAPTFSWTQNNGSVVLAAYRGVHATQPIKEAASVAGLTPTTGGAIVSPAITATVTGVLVGFWGANPGAQTSANPPIPSGYTQRFLYADTGGFFYFDALLADKLVAPGAVAAASIGQPAGWGNTNGNVDAAHLTLNPANTAPNAPTLTSPASNATIDRGIVQRFAWTPSDPDAGDSQSKFDLQYRTIGAGTWVAVTGTTPNAYWDAAAGTFAAGNYEWQVRTYDALGVVGPWSPSSFFTAADAPALPTITAPTSGGTVSNTATVTWSTPNQTDYQLRRVADNAGSPNTGTVYYDSGDVVSSTIRSQALTFETNNRFEHIQVRIKYNGLWSAWASIRVQVSYTPPTVPVVSLLADDDAGSLVVTVTNPAPGAGVPATAYNDVYVDDGSGEERKATMLAPNTSWTYWTPVALRDYAGHVRVVAVATNGTTASS